VTYTFNGKGLPTGTTVPDRGDQGGFVYRYDTNGRLDEITDVVDRKLTLSYQGSDRKVWQIKAAFDGDRILATYTYDQDEQLVSVADAAGHLTKYEYEDRSVNLSHDLQAVTTPRGTESATAGDFRTKFTYNGAALAGEEFRRIKDVGRPHKEGANPTVDLVTSFAYVSAIPNGATATTKVTSPRGAGTDPNSHSFTTDYQVNARGTR
jgi:YD repeat-containing protein